MSHFSVLRYIYIYIYGWLNKIALQQICAAYQTGTINTFAHGLLKKVFLSTDLCQQICDWPKLLEKRPPALKRGTFEGTFLLKITNLLTFLDFPKILPKNRPAQGAYKAKILTQHIIVVWGGVG